MAKNGTIRALLALGLSAFAQAGALANASGDDDDKAVGAMLDGIDCTPIAHAAGDVKQDAGELLSIKAALVSATGKTVGLPGVVDALAMTAAMHNELGTETRAAKVKRLRDEAVTPPKATGAQAMQKPRKLTPEQAMVFAQPDSPVALIGAFDTAAAMIAAIEEVASDKATLRDRAHYDVVVVGAGFAGAVMAERLAADAGLRVKSRLLGPQHMAYESLRLQGGIDSFTQYSAAVSAMTELDMADMKAKIVALASNADLRARLGQGALARAKNTYDWSVVIPQMQELWGEQAARKASTYPSPNAARMVDAPMNGGLPTMKSAFGHSAALAPT